MDMDVQLLLPSIDGSSSRVIDSSAMDKADCGIRVGRNVITGVV
jgi:hypothetical protein